MTNSSYYVGVDLGQARDATAIAIVHSYREVLQVRNRVTMEFGTKEWLVLRQVERVRLGTDYTTVVARVGQVVRALTGLGKVTVVPDGTGVGRPVVDMLRKAAVRAEIVPVIITGGHGQGESRGYRTVAKKDLIHGLSTLVEKGELSFASDMSGNEMLREEMAKMSRRTLSGEPDDMVFAVALACWRARRGKVGESGCLTDLGISRSHSAKPLPGKV